MSAKTGLGGKTKTKPLTPQTDNFIESIRDIGGAGLKSLKEDLLAPAPKDLLDQLFGGIQKYQTKVQKELHPGQSIEIDSMLREQQDENRVLKLKLAREQQVRQEDEIVVEQKSQNLKLELSALSQEVNKLAKVTRGLARETQIAAMQAPANPGVYHLVFFEKLREFIQSFRKKIENASLWLQSSNKRAAKKRTFWGQVSKSGSKRLLSPEDYSQRSAG